MTILVLAQADYSQRSRDVTLGTSASRRDVTCHASRERLRREAAS